MSGEKRRIQNSEFRKREEIEQKITKEAKKKKEGRRKEAKNIKIIDTDKR